MIRGPNKIVACPACKKLAKCRSLVSGNTLGATLWSDGLLEAPMLPLPQEIVRCNGCGHVYWLKDAQKLGELSVGDEGESASPPEWHEAEYVKEPDEGGYYHAIRSGLARTREEERNARIRAWWKSNESLRRNINAILSWTDVGGRQANLECLIALLDENNDSDLIMEAEILRELGRFDGALAILRKVHQGDHSLIVQQIERFCKEGDTLLKCVNLDNDNVEPHSPSRVPYAPERYNRGIIDRIKVKVLSLFNDL